MSAARTILRNSLFGVASEVAGGALFFAAFIMLARYLGSERFGQLSYVLAIAGIFQLVADLGLTNVVVREVAAARDRVGEIFATLQPLIWMLSIGCFGLIAAVAYLASPDAELFGATLFLGAAALATFHAVAYASVCRAYEEMGFNAVGNLTHKLVLLGCLAAAIVGRANLVGLGAAFLAGNLYQCAFFYAVVKRRYARQLRWRIDWRYARYLVAEAVPVGMAMICRRLNLHVDTLLLAALSSSGAVGLFSAAYKVIQVIDMLPFTLAMPLFPPFSRFARESRAALFAAVDRAFRVFLAIAFPLAGWLYFLAPELIVLLYGAPFADAASALRILAASVLFLFPTALYSYVFIAMGEARFYTLASAICLALKIVLDCALIVPLGHDGAAYGTLVAEIAFFASGALFLRRLGCRTPWLTLAAKPAAATLVSCAAAFAWMPAARPLELLAGATLLYGIGYLGVGLLLGAVRRDEFAALRDAILLRARP